MLPATFVLLLHILANSEFRARTRVMTNQQPKKSPQDGTTVLFCTEALDVRPLATTADAIPTSNLVRLTDWRLMSL